MSRFTIDTPKPPQDRWPILVDFSRRLKPDTTEDSEGNPVREEIYAVNVTAYRLWGYDEVKDEIDLDGAKKVGVTVYRWDGSVIRRTWPVEGQDSLQIRFPTSYGAVLDQSVIDANTITIGPEGLNNQVSFVIKGGVSGNRYAVRVRVRTTDNNEHSCVLRFNVEELPL